MPHPSIVRVFVSIAALWLASFSIAQQVCLPLPRLLTVMPMGGQVGTSLEMTITGENLDDSGELLFSSPKITAKPKLAADGKVEANKFMVTIAPDAPSGVHEARIMARLGISSSRAFSVGTLPEVTRTKPNNSLETAMELKAGTVCNAVMTKRAIDFYAFEAVKGKRTVVDCAAAGIDSKLTAVLIVADAQGRDLLVNRTGGILDFTPPADGKYFIKVHGLTFQGGAEYFYRLALLEPKGTEAAPRQASTRLVSSFSWTPDGKSSMAEIEPNNQHDQAQKITLPCDVSGKFFPAADVDTFEFTAKKAEVWWIEVVSERLGLPTDPFVLVQQVTKDGDKEKLTDVAELNDIPSPVKLSSNGYSYDGSPYDAGSADVLGKLEIKEDGIYRLQLRDLFGGTRSDAGNIYRLSIRKAAPDFSLVAWAVHMTLRNGDRNALSKPIALRGGASMAFEVVVVRKDGFDGEIELGMEGLPAGISAQGLKIPAGKNQGMMIVTAAENAPRSLALAKLVGRAQINGATITRQGRMASMAWPSRDAGQEIPTPRLIADVPVSAGGSEVAPLTIAPSENKVWEAKAGDKLTVPLKVAWRGDFTGALKLKAWGAGFEGIKEIDVPLKATTAEVVIDLAALKTPPGDYALAFYTPAVAKYRYNPDAVKRAEAEQKKAEEEAASLAAAAKKLADEANAASSDKKLVVANALKAMTEKLKIADATKADATKRMKVATETAMPKDTVDIVVSEPIRISVKSAQVTTAAVSANK